MAHRFDARDADFEQRFQALLDAKREVSSDVNAVVSGIIDDVRARGDEAVADLTAKFDRWDAAPDTLRLDRQDIDHALGQCDAETLEALKLACARIEAHHRRQVPADDRYTDDAGVELGHRWTAVDAVGLYVPGGTAAYPSSVLMNALPAKVAGVERIVMVVPTPDEVMNPLVLAAAKLAGVDEIYRIGGAQAVAALAYGTERIAPVSKIVGPGNAYVAAAKRQVFGTVGIDMIAGPSEVLVVADRDNDPAWIAADLLAQAEHDASAQSILITDDGDLADAVERQVQRQLQSLPRAEMAGQSWAEFGAVITVNATLKMRLPLVDRVAPEHLEIADRRPGRAARRHPQCRRDLPRRPHARSGRRLCRRLQSCAADRAQRPVLVRPRRARLHETHLAPALWASRPRRDRPGRDDARPRRRARSPCALGRDAARTLRPNRGG